jgi:hypothetical protein
MEPLLIFLVQNFFLVNQQFQNQIFNINRTRRLHTTFKQPLEAAPATGQGHF